MRYKPFSNFELDQKLIRFGRSSSYLTMGDGCENVIVVGGIGSSKSTSSFFTIGKSLLEAGCGGYGFGVKEGARHENHKMAWKAGRGYDVIDFSPGSGQRFNWIDYESKKSSGGRTNVEHLMEVFGASSEVISRRMGQQSSEPFWEFSWRQMLKNFLFLDLHANGGIDFLRVLEMCQNLPRDVSDLEDWSKFKSTSAYMKAEKNCPASESRSLHLAKNYLELEMPGLSDKTRSCIQQMCSAMLDPHVRDLYQDAFGGESTWTPDDVERGAFVIVGYDIERHGIMGQLINCIVRNCGERALPRRRGKFGADMSKCRPVVFVLDEAPFLVDAHSERFLRSGRENRAVSLWAIQSVASMTDELGGGEVARNRVDGLLGHFHTKIMHQNECDVTNLKMAEIISKDVSWKLGFTAPEGGNGANPGRNWNQQVDYVVPPIAFKQLKRGGLKFKWDVRAIVTMAGHQWEDGRWWSAIKFFQNCEPVSDRTFLQCYPRAPICMWLDQKSTARIWVKHVSFSRFVRAVLRKPRAAKWHFYRWLAFWFGVEANSGVYEECEREIHNG